MSIREATQADYPALCAVFAEVQALHQAALPHIFRAPDGPALSAEFIAETVADPNAALLVAEQGGQIVGLAHIALTQSTGRPMLISREYAVVHSLAVHNEHRHAGIGRALMERAHSWARDKGVSEVELNVWEFNVAAITFYEKLGYATASRKMWVTLT